MEARSEGMFSEICRKKKKKKLYFLIFGYQNFDVNVFVN